MKAKGPGGKGMSNDTYSKERLMINSTNLKQKLKNLYTKKRNRFKIENLEQKISSGFGKYDSCMENLL